MKRLALSLLLIVPSLGIVYKFGRIYGLIAYLLIVSCSIFLRPDKLITDRNAPLLAWLTFLFLLIAFLIIYPTANSGFYGGGSDADDALDIAARAILHGQYPYYLKTYLGNPIGPMPGAVFLSMPFVLVYGSALQNIFWLAGLFFIVRWLADAKTALCLLLLLLVFSPVVMWNVLTGTDELANTIYVLIFTLLLIKGKSKRLWAFLLGVGLSSRANFILLTPLIFSALVYTEGIKRALIHTLIACLVCLAVTLLFYLYDSHGFTPLRGQFSKAAGLPFAPLASGLISLLLAWKYVRDAQALLIACAVVQLVAVGLSAILTGSGLSYSPYGIFFSLFGILGIYIRAR